MKAYQCDRCFKYYTENKDVVVPGTPSDFVVTGINIMKGHGTDRVSIKQYDLCDDCARELVDWITFRKG